MKHGKASTYTNHKCRCDECRRAWAAYFRSRNKARRQQRQALGICIECKQPATRGLRCALHAELGNLRVKIANQNKTIRRLLENS